MRTIVPITCVLCLATSSRADTPPADAPPAEAPPAQAPPARASSDFAPVKAPVQHVAPEPGDEDPVAPQPRHSRVPEIIATIVTGGFTIATGVGYWKWNDALDRRRAAQWDPTITAEEHSRNIEDVNTWKRRTWILIGATFASAAVTAFTWMRNQDPSSFSVQPTGDGDGAAVSYGGRF